MSFLTPVPNTLVVPNPHYLRSKNKNLDEALDSNTSLANIIGVDVSEIPKICGSKCSKKYYPNMIMEDYLDAFDCQPDNNTFDCKPISLQKLQHNEFIESMKIAKLEKILQYKLNLS